MMCVYFELSETAGKNNTEQGRSKQAGTKVGEVGEKKIQPTLVI